ncbi:hypothetical protein Q7A53_05260 [Halobacillus rhizosphaerae]|uniref:hypothetical protein n=1 Tax=Halobacillus rhizosphaerae TaxID=3064889 RepID=UPI00398B1718
MFNQLNKDDIYKVIINWQMEMGEDFLDYFESNLTIPSYMFWCLGKGYLSKERFNEWEKQKSLGNFESDSAMSVVYNHYDNDNGFAVVHSDDWEEEKEKEAYMILAEFISESNTYKTRLNDFLRDYE